MYNMSLTPHRKHHRKPPPSQRAQVKPVHIRIGKHVYAIGTAASKDEWSTVLDTFLRSCSTEEDSVAALAHASVVPAQHRHTQDDGEQPGCWFLDINTFAYQHIVWDRHNDSDLDTKQTRKGTMVDWMHLPPSQATWEQVERHITKHRKRSPTENLCQEHYWAGACSFQIDVYVNGYYPPCKHLEQRARHDAWFAGLLRTKALGAEPRMSPASVTSTDSLLLWTAFFVAHPEAADDVYIDQYLFQRNLTLCIGDEGWRTFVDWVMEGQSLSWDDVWARYVTHVEYPHPGGHSTERSVTLPFTPKQCPRVLRPEFLQPLGWLYILSIEGSSHLKIGYSLVSPRKRLDQMQVGVPHRLTLLGAYPTTRDRAPKLESFVHEVLKDARQGKTEWFAVDLPTAQQACRTAILHKGSTRYFWTSDQWMAHEEEMEERRAEYYEEYPWEDPDYEWPD